MENRENNIVKKFGIFIHHMLLELTSRRMRCQRHLAYMNWEMHTDWVKSCGLESLVCGFGLATDRCEHSWSMAVELHPNNLNREEGRSWVSYGNLPFTPTKHAQLPTPPACFGTKHPSHYFSAKSPPPTNTVVDVSLCPPVSCHTLSDPNPSPLTAPHFIQKRSVVSWLLAVGQTTLALQSRQWSQPHGWVQWWWWQLLLVTSNHPSSPCAVCCLTGDTSWVTSGSTLMGTSVFGPFLWDYCPYCPSHCSLIGKPSWSLQTAYHRSCHSSCYLDPYRCGYYVALKCQDLTAQWPTGTEYSIELSQSVLWEMNLI